jgi:DNA-binding GntR family transcriptional regulator
VAPPIEFRTKAELAYSYLHDLILTGRLQPGDRVRISHVARDLGVSDIPVRESVARLEAEGVLHTEPHRGAIVARLAPADIEELFAIRAELESLAIRRAADVLTDEQFEQLGDLIERMDAAERDGDGTAYGDLSREFNLAIYRAQPYARLTSMIRDLWVSTDWSQRIFERDTVGLRRSAQEQREIYDALRRRDGDAAAELVRGQKQRAGAWLVQHGEPPPTPDPGDT